MAKSLREIIFILLTTMIHPFLCSREKNRKETLSKTSISFNIGNERQASCGKQKKPNLIPEWHLIKLSDSGKINSGGGWHMEGLICVN